MRERYFALAVLALVAGSAGGIWYERERMSASMEGADQGPEILYWVAPMDANFRKDGPGKSPMGMDLVPVYEGDAPSGDPETVTLSAAEVNSIGVRTATARMEEIGHRIETVGFVDYDAHATSHIHTRVEGWIERLEPRAVGDEVAKGDLLFNLYAPEITIASSELMRATRSGDRDDIAIARTKLMNFGVGAAQIEEMAQADTPAQRIRFHAPQNGVVFALDAADGMYLRPETRAMSLADTGTVWLMVDVFERDIGLLTEDMRAEARFDHLPGQTLAGEIDYIFPELDPETRTLRVRLRFDNADGLLRPNMFAKVTLTPKTGRQALTVPSEAVIRTGRAERVILRLPDGSFRPRLVTTGLRGGFGEGQRTEIVQGLDPGEEVVASAQFLIDSESALNAGMMRFAPTEGEPASGKGVLLALDPAARRARIAHDPIEALGWPALETGFALRADLYLDDLTVGDAVEFHILRDADGLLSLTRLRGDDGVDATGEGIVHAVTPDGKLTVSHDPIPALGWPAMRMDLGVAGFDPATVPIGTPVVFDLAEGTDGMAAIVAVRAAGEAARMPETEETATEAAPITVEGRILTVDAQAGTATIDHGPIAEIGMPGMTMEFALSERVEPDTLPKDETLMLRFVRPDGMTMVLDAFEPAPTPMTVTGTINRIDPEAGTANVTHGPIREIGMPGMTMDFTLADGVAPESLPVGRETGLLLLQGADMSMSLAGTVEPGQ